MRINHNIASLNTYRQLSGNPSATSKSHEKLSSGLRINRAGDDAAGLAISEKMRGQIRGLDQASSNAQDGISLIQTAEGALAETHSILQRMRELAVQSSTDTNTAEDREKIQAEVDQLAKEITRISNTTEFNTKNLLAGGLTNNVFHIGANAGQNVSISIEGMDAKSLGVSRDINQVNSFTATSSTLTSAAIANEDLGSGLVAATYTVEVTHNAAAVASTGKTVTGAVAVTGQNYTGARSETGVIFRVTAIGVPATGDVTAAEVSTDGGLSWSGATVDASAAGTSTITYGGSTFTIADNGANAVGNTVTMNFNARYDSIQLSQGGTDIGAAATVYSDQDYVTIGDAATDRTITIRSTSLGDLVTDAAGTTVTVATQASTAAVIGTDGSVTAAADTKAGINVKTQSAADKAITTINNALETVSSERSKLGAMQNRLEHTIANLGTSSENLTASESRVRDVDMAKEMMAYTKNNILTQAATAMLAQANQQPQGVLQLLQ
ncbi:MAG: flagellin [Clostridiaceae bacterium]